MNWQGFGLGMLPLFAIWFFWAAVVGGVVLLIVRLVGDSSGSSSGGRSSEAEEILKQRYARGELSKEQYDEMLDHLRR